MVRQPSDSQYGPIPFAAEVLNANACRSQAYQRASPDPIELARDKRSGCLDATYFFRSYADLLCLLLLVCPCGHGFLGRRLFGRKRRLLILVKQIEEELIGPM
jgi:hypothetical protein